MTSNILGSLIFFVGTILALCTHLIIKGLSGNVDFLVIIFSRYFFSLPILLILAIYIRKKSFFHVTNWINICIRSFFGIATMTSVFLAIQLIPLGLVTALAQSSAIFVTMLAPIFLSEKIGLIRWIAVIIGLMGIFFMTNPIGIIYGTEQLSSVGIILAILSSFFHAGLAISLRKLGLTEHPSTSSFIHNSITTLVILTLILSLGSQFIGIAGRYSYDVFFTFNLFLVSLIILGTVGSFVQFFMATGYKYAEASILVSIRYLAIPLAAISGYLIWGETLTINQILGGILVLSSCIIITLRELKYKK